MTKRLDAILRRLAPLTAAGVLLQVGGCQVDTASLVGGLITTVATSLITGVFFGP